MSEFGHNMGMRTLFVASLFFLLPVFAFAEGPDISVSASDIRFSEEVLASGDTIRVYTTLRNIGDTDMTGYVFFYQGSSEIGASQVVTLVANGVPEEVWVDFEVPYGSFNIRAEVKGQNPEDTNPGNDLAITPLYDPILDEDGDGIEDDEDNCPETANADQLDSDGDGAGDACDADDDNDGVQDDVEEELGTSPTNADTDGDGASDLEDAYPTNPDLQEEYVAPVIYVEEEVVEEPEEEVLEEQVAEEAAIELEGGDVLTGFSEPDVGALVSPNASFTFIQEDWTTYAFEVVTPSDQIERITWNFGDGVTSAQRVLTHTYREPGMYDVILTIVDRDGEVSVDSQQIEISFFHLTNPYVQLSVGALAFFLLMSFFFALHRNTVQPSAEVVSTKELPKENKTPAYRRRKRSKKNSAHPPERQGSVRKKKKKRSRHE